MQSFLNCILRSPDVYAEVNDELSRAEASGHPPESMSLSEAQHHLPYFQACLNESMRISPALGSSIARKVPPGGCTLGGEFIPGGTRLALNPHVLHRDKTAFGEDVDVFRPKRWLEATPEKIKEMERNMYQVSRRQHETFSSRPRWQG